MNINFSDLEFIFFYFAFLLIFPLSNNNFAQFDDFVQLKTPNSYHINRIEIADNGEIFVCTELKGIHHSSDNGKTWRTIGMNDQSIQNLKMDRNGIYYMVVAPYYPHGVDNPGVFKSIDRGESWELITSGLEDPYIRDLVIDLDNNKYIGSKSGGVYQYVDTSSVWEYIGLKDMFVRSLNVDSNGWLYAAVDGNGVFRKLNARMEWEKLGSISFNRCPEINISKNDIIYLALGHDNPLLAMGIYKSEDYGETWKEINNGISDFNIQTICSDDNEVVYAGAPNGRVYKSLDKGESWVSIDYGHTVGVVKSLRITQNGGILQGSWGGGLLGSDDKGNSWYKSGPDGNAGIKSIQFFEDNIYCVTTGGLYVSNDFGESWMGLNKNLPSNDVGDLVIVDKENLVVGTWGGGFYHSSDLGVSWKKNTDIPIQASVRFVRKSSVTNSIFISVINDGHGLYKSVDKGKTFEKIMNWERPESMTISPNGEMLVGTWDIHYSNDDGESWKRIRKGISYISCVNLDTQHSIYAGSIDGFFYSSTDYGENWNENFYPNMGFTSFYDIDENTFFMSTYENKNYLYNKVNNTYTEISSEWLKKSRIYNIYNHEGKLFIGTSNGLYYSDNKIMNTEKECIMPSSFILTNAYPNPFNPSTTIEYMIPSLGTTHSFRGMVELKIYDQLGSLVQTLVNEAQAPGTYKVIFDGSNLSSGVYYYQLRYDKLVETKKTILIK